MILSLACNLHVILPIVFEFNAIDAIGINHNIVSEAILLVSVCVFMWWGVFLSVCAQA